MNAAIAQHLNIAENLITEVQEWAHVLWVRVKGLGARFVSKKVAKMEGTKKQIKWAESLKAEFLRKLDAEYKRCNMYSADEYEAIKDAANNRHQASWWIDRRFDGHTRLVSNVLGRSAKTNSVIF